MQGVAKFAKSVRSYTGGREYPAERALCRYTSIMTGSERSRSGSTVGETFHPRGACFQ